MAASGAIEHKGIVARTEGRNVFVKVLAESACASCKIRPVCSADTKEKLIEVADNSVPVNPGDTVSVLISEKQGFKALFLGYLLPFILVLGSLLLIMSITGDEGMAGLFSILILIPYYLLLALFKKRFKKKFQFRIQKLSE